jgi:hypothetical protein
MSGANERTTYMSVANRDSTDKEIGATCCDEQRWNVSDRGAAHLCAEYNERSECTTSERSDTRRSVAE